MNTTLNSLETITSLERPPSYAQTRVSPVTATSSASSLELRSVSFFGRTLAEYAQFFALDIAALKGKSVLDVAAGPSSFTAEACKRGVDAVAVDPLYGCRPDALAAHVAIDYRAMFAQMRTKPGLFRLGKAFASIDEAEESRRAAAARFLADYEAQFVHNRYVGTALPQLPFLDRAFDVVLCAHFLFLYAKQFDLSFHVEACRELVRVSRDEVKIHPVLGLGGKRYAQLKELRAALAADRIVSEIVRVDYEFFAGADEMLVLKRAAG
ncbi:methyltransferase [Nibricoccus aquaticus]|uniref:Methyltransferase n=1 Tax=Nibricoccus aquaticus TaxID=2576891 RepID=A0A290Q4Q9_9BACT|nr:methyltransferase [Nibricoccus aquaticus]